MSAFDGNGFFYNSYIENSTVSNTSITTSIITTSSINMLDINNNYQNIINVKNPVNSQDAATKYYVDSLGLLFNITLSNTTPTLLSNIVQGTSIIMITNQVLNGPCAIFHAVKSNSSECPGIFRSVCSPGNGNTLLDLTWKPNNGIYLYKTTSLCDGSYTIKIF